MVLDAGAIVPYRPLAAKPGGGFAATGFSGIIGAMRRSGLLIIGILLLALIPGARLPAQPLEEGFRSLAAEWDKTLRRAEAELARGGVTAGRGEELRERINKVRSQAQGHARSAQREADKIGALLVTLGPSPAEGEPAEAADVKTKRVQLDAALADLSGQVKQSDLTVTRADALLRQISAEQLERHTIALVEQWPSPLAPPTWIAAGGQLFSISKQTLSAEVVKGGKTNLIVLLPVAIGTYIAVVFGRAIRRRIQQRWGRDPAVTDPSYGRRLIAAVIDGVARGLIPVVVIAIVLATAWWLIVADRVDPTVGAPWGLLYAIVFYLLTAALVRATFSPELPNWRVIPIAADASAQIGRRLNLIALVFAIDMGVSWLFERVGEPKELASLHSFILNVFLAVVMFSLLRSRLWQVERSAAEWHEEQPRAAVAALSSYVRAPVGLITAAAVVCGMLGYAVLADYLLHTTIFTLLMVGAMVALRFPVREAFARLIPETPGTAVTVTDALVLRGETHRVVGFWVMAGLDLMLVVGGVLLGLVLWGIPPRVLGEWLAGVFQGFNIGSYRFSLADLLLAIVAFAAILVVTRLLQRFLEFRLFPNTRLDMGVRTAIGSGLGYIGVGLAILAAISTLGIDLTGLAVVAGALSVGIGFGLQNVVNNFISGIILLVERPVKVGDTVTIREHEGVVKRIKVRSTEIETGGHASVIIPNAELLQSAVINWTLRDRRARGEIRITVSYDAEVDQVEGILKGCATDHPKVMKRPEPAVLLIDFNERGAEFSLGFQLSDLADKGAVTSDLRKQILRRLHAAGIDIPTPQRSVVIQQPLPAEVGGTNS